MPSVQKDWAQFIQAIADLIARLRELEELRARVNEAETSSAHMSQEARRRASKEVPCRER